MSVETENTAAPAPAAEEDFIALDGDLGNFEEESSSESETEDDDEGTFNPDRIALADFRKLLSYYATTIEEVHRRKAMMKMQPKPEKGSKSRAQKRAGSASANLRGALLLQRTDFNPSEVAHIQAEVDKFLKLDAWRYEEMPRIIEERRSKGSDTIMDKEDYITTMDWKTRHGVPRPTLMGMVKSNQTKNIVKSTREAIKLLPPDHTDESLPKASMDALQSLRGVGVATASLVLSLATGSGNHSPQIPFYSDDLYLWLCLKDYPDADPTEKPEPTISGAGAAAPVASADAKKLAKHRRPNGELNVKYSITEYKHLFNAAGTLRARLNSQVEDGESISHNDIEKVAYVLRNIAVSGFYEGVDSLEILKARAAQREEAEKVIQAERDALNASAESMRSKKRKREEKENKAKQGGRNKKKKE